MRKATISHISALRRISHMSFHLTKPTSSIASLQSNFTSSIQHKSTKSLQHWTQKDFKYSTKIQTRWMDNDIYGHVNNVVYYSYFDTVVNRFLIEKGSLKIHENKHKTEDNNAIGVVVESNCQYFKSLSFPDIVVACLRVKKMGKTSVTYEIGIFPESESQSICAFGFFVHVFVDRDSRKPVLIPDKIRNALEEIVHEPTQSKL